MVGIGTQHAPGRKVNRIRRARTERRAITTPSAALVVLPEMGACCAVVAGRAT